MIRVHFIGRTGNNLFQYAFGRVLSERLGYSLTYVNDNHATQFNIPEIHKVSIESPSIDFNDTLDQSIDIETILKKGIDKQINIGGYWQKSKFYVPYRNELQSWMALPKSEYTQYTNPDKDVILHIRRDDYILARSNIELNYYDRCLQSLGELGKVYIIGSGIDGKVKRHFAKYDVSYFDGDPFQDFIFMQGFKRVIMSNSSFCWMATFLSPVCEKVFFPKPVSGFWSDSENQRLYIEGYHTLVDNVKVGVD
jgi:hypothetical protein